MTPRQNPAPPTLLDRRHFLHTAGLFTGAAMLTKSDALAGGVARTSDHLARTMENHDRACADRYGRLLAQAAEREGVRIRTDMLAFASKHKALLVAAPAEGLERIDPIRLVDGIVQGVVYYSLSSRGSRPGFYAVTAFAPQGVTLGEIPVRVEFSENRRPLFSLPGTAVVSSLTVPAGAGRDVQVELGLDLTSEDGPTNRTCWTCPNGVRICTIHDPDAPMPPRG